MRPGRIARLALALLLLGAVRAWGQAFYEDPADPVLDGDVVDEGTGRPAEIVPGVPWIRPGVDGQLGTADDELHPEFVGDVDLVVRTVAALAGNEIPATAPLRGALPQGIAEPFGDGVRIRFAVAATDGRSVAAPPYFDGLPVMVAVFADLDADGYIGITELDGDAGDAALEAAELVDIGRRYALGRHGVARGRISLDAGGPLEAPLRVAFAAAAYAGPYRDTHFGGVVPDGPLVMTRLPFFPVTAPGDALAPGFHELRVADPDGRVGFRALPAFPPDPAAPGLIEAFTLRLDGSDPTIDLAQSLSGRLLRFGAAQQPDPSSYLALSTRPLRPGLDSEGRPVALEILRRVVVADDGPASVTKLRIVPLDRLGNVADVESPLTVRLRTKRTVAILEPDLDGDPYQETVRVEDARGFEILLDDGGGVYDDPNRDELIIKAHGRPTRIDLDLPDPDVDDDGTVKLKDLDPIERCQGVELGDLAFHPDLDVDGNGRIDERDVHWVEAQLDLEVDKDGKRQKGRYDGELNKWKRPKRAKSELEEQEKALRQLEKERRKAEKKAGIKATKSKGKCQLK